MSRLDRSAHGLGASRRRVAAVCCVLAVGVVLAGCASLPDHSAVQRGRGGGTGSVQANVSYRPPGPVSHGDRQTIVRGYLDAMLAAPPDPSVVREFMTPGAAGTWQPAQRTMVYQSATVGDVSSTGVPLDADVLGSIDARGSWTSATSSDSALAQHLSMIQVGGQWRIANPVAGTLVDEDYIERHLHQYSMYFFDPTHTVLTPDPVYLPLGYPARTTNALVSGLLVGPTSSTDGVVGNDLPPGTGLAHPVTVGPGGLAVISLDQQASGMTGTDLRFFAAQLVWTLRQERLGVTRIRLLVGGQPVQIPGLDEDFSVFSLTGYSPTGFSSERSLYALDDGHLVAVTVPNDAVTPAGRLGTEVRSARSAAIQLVGPQRGALVSTSGTTVVVGGLSLAADVQPNAVWFRGGVDLLKPSWDVHGLLWLVDRTSHGAVIRVLRGPHDARVIDAPGISGRDVQAFAVSRDGSRFAAIVGTGATAHLVIAMVQRDPTLALDVSLIGARVVSNAQFPLTNLSQVTWYSPTVLAVLAQDQGGEPQPYQISIDGSKVVPSIGFLPVVPQSLAAVGDPTAPNVPLVVGAANGRLYSRDSSQQWVPLDLHTKLFAPVYPG
jgi:hypothetical protein